LFSSSRFRLVCVCMGLECRGEERIVLRRA
jgi:hypothetical protein